MPEPLVLSLGYFPDGMEPDDDNSRHYRVDVIYRGTYVRRSDLTFAKQSWYEIQHNGQSLSRAGHWSWTESFQRWQYRFTLEEAKEQAAAVVNSVKVMGLTYTEFKERIGQ